MANTRRSSIFASAGGRSSIMPSYSSTAIKDTRPIRDATFRTESSQNIQSYLSQHGSQVELSAKWSVSPTQREFQNLFRFLADSLIGPGFPWGKKFDDDCLSILRDLRYPAMETNWPNLLAMLNWMVELCKAQDHWHDPDIVSDPLLWQANELPLDYPQLEDRLLWDFSSKMYKEWFDGVTDDDFSHGERELEEAFERITLASGEECERLETEVSKRDVELRQLQAQEPPLKRIEEEYVQLMSDKTKFIAFIDLHRQKADKLKQGNTKARSVVQEHARNIASAASELQEAEAAVSAQNLSADEVNRMNHERESLSRHLDELRTKIVEASKAAYDQEMLVTKSMDRFEQLLQDYEALSHQIGTTTSVSDPFQHPELPNVNFSIDIDLGAESLSDIQESGRSAMQAIRPALQQYCESFRRQASELQDDAIALEEQHERIAQEVEIHKEELSRREERLNFVHEQAEEAKSQLQAETIETNRTVAKLETEVTAMSTASQQGVLASRSNLEGKRIAFKELRHRTQQQQEHVIQQLMSHIDVIIKAKDHTANSLSGVRSFAEAQ
ncbi:kinetochore-associated Ndc80 complex subunit ndc80 [Vanrija albida]|uniref:Kinetochore protein NDC80 n=1 Tax=Vanrija albida TaxID=181172 RepID=A0ABR3Q110_9TREE